MRIQESFSAPVSAGGTGKTSAASGNGAESVPAASSAEDLVALSSASDYVAQALQSGSSDRAARIQALTAQVQAGTYSVSPDALSASIIGGVLRGY